MPVGCSHVLHPTCACSDPAPDEFDESDDESDAAAREGPQLSTTQLAWVSIGRLLVGIAVCAIFSDPLVDALAVFSKASGIPPFFVAFVLTPLGSSAGELISSLRFASKRRQKNISLTFSQVRHAACSQAGPGIITPRVHAWVCSRVC